MGAVELTPVDPVSVLLGLVTGRLDEFTILDPGAVVPGCDLLWPVELATVGLMPDGVDPLVLGAVML